MSTSSERVYTYVRLKILLPLIWGIVSWCMLFSCSNEAPPTARAIRNRDSLPVMETYGVSKLISDSGVIRYKIIAEEWKVYDKTSPPKQTFMKGVFLEKFDEKFHVELYITADTAYCFNQNLWELRGRVFIKNTRGATVSTDELYWDMGQHLLYSNKFAQLTTPDEKLEGTRFRSNEQMTNFDISNSSGYRPMPGDNLGHGGDMKVDNDSVPIREKPEKFGRKP